MSRETVEQAMDVLIAWAGPVPEVLETPIDKQNNRRAALAKLIIQNTLDTASESDAEVLSMLANRINKKLHERLERLVGIQSVSEDESVFRLVYNIDPETSKMSLVVKKETMPILQPYYGKSTGIVWTGAEHFRPSNGGVAHASGLDLEIESMAALADSVVAAATKKILGSILDYAPRRDGRKWIKEFRNAQTPEDKVEYATKFCFVINRAANNIGFVTRRGAGNTLVCTPEVFEILCCVPSLITEKSPLPAILEPNTMYRAGKTYTGYEVFVSLLPTDDVIVAYRGMDSFDTGVVLAINNLAYVDPEDGALKYRLNDFGLFDKEFYRVIQY
jgi:hypothetical protein